jgi:hypothetical protein
MELRGFFLSCMILHDGLGRIRPVGSRVQKMILICMSLISILSSEIFGPDYSVSVEIISHSLRTSSKQAAF